MSGSDRLDGRVAVVTGSTRGVGLTIAQALSRSGVHVVINGSSSQEAASRITCELAGGRRLPHGVQGGCEVAGRRVGHGR